MADFFSNLLLRSSSPTSGAILQPRLPSLFESPHGVDELSTPPAAQSHEDVSPPGPFTFTAPVEHIVQAAKQDTGLSGRRATGRVPSLEISTRMMPLEKDSRTITPPPTQVQAWPEPGRTILPEYRQETVFSAESVVEMDNASALRGSGQGSQSGKRLTKEKSAARESAGSALGARNILQSPAESTISTSSSARKPVLTPQFSPAASTSRQTGTQVEQAAQNETVVQVHIGRIEVRAVPPATAPSQPVRTGPAAKVKMSLEDYLRQREEKR